jgi:hypothetical protein
MHLEDQISAYDPDSEDILQFMHCTLKLSLALTTYSILPTMRLKSFILRINSQMKAEKVVISEDCKSMMALDYVSATERTATWSQTAPLRAHNVLA